jgi:hypothetical protein
MRVRMRAVLVGFFIAVFAGFGLPARAAGQGAFVSGGALVDIKRYSSGTGPQVYDGEAVGGYVGAGAFVTRRFSAEFEAAFSAEASKRLDTPVVIPGTSQTSNFTTTFQTKVEAYSAMFAVHTSPTARLHLSYRGGVTFIHHRRTILPPEILPANPAANTVALPTTLVENVAGPAVGVDADFVLSPRLSIVGALRVHAFTVATDLSAFSIRPMAGVRVRFSR